MKAFGHGEYIVLDGTEDELRHVAESLEKAEKCEEARGRISRGLERGATRIALSEEWVVCLYRYLSADEGESMDGLLTELERSLEDKGIEPK